MKNITAHTGDVANSAETFDVNSKYLYYLTDTGSEFRYVARYDLATGKSEVVEKAPWDVSYTYFSHNGKYRVTAINEDARTKIKIYDTATGKLVSSAATSECRHHGREYLAKRKADGVLSERRSQPEQSLRLRLRNEESDEADRQLESGDQSGRSRRFAGDSLQVVRRRGDSFDSLQAKACECARTKCRRWCWFMVVQAGRRALVTAR